MKHVTTLRELFANKQICVPDYQRAYTWVDEHTKTFIKDIDDYVSSHSERPYYYGHFLFERIADSGVSRYAVIDGQQRLTTAVMFVVAIYKRLFEIAGVASVEELDKDLQDIYTDVIKSGYIYRFSTVSYDDLFFRDYVVDQSKAIVADTLSKRRIKAAFDNFTKLLKDCDEEALRVRLYAIIQASCTTRVVVDTIDAVQLFMFENNRGKSPTKLEVIKAEMMYHVHLHATQEQKQPCLKAITERFEQCYKSIAGFEKIVDDDELLNYAVALHRNNLHYIQALEYVQRGIKTEGIPFIEKFVCTLVSCCEAVKVFLDEAKKDLNYHALLQIGHKPMVFPIILKAKRMAIAQGDFSKLAVALWKLCLRNRIVSSRAVLLNRLNDVYQNDDMGTYVKEIVGRINWMKTTTARYFNNWNDKAVQDGLNRGVSPESYKLILWLYENHLIDNGKQGYVPFLRFDAIHKPHLEHIAPQTEQLTPNSGYCSYDDEFREQYLHSLGNYLLLSDKHNIAIGNKPFQEKRATYEPLWHHREVRDMTAEDGLWDKNKIRKREEKIRAFLHELLK